jgi:hypothetical protein
MPDTIFLGQTAILAKVEATKGTDSLPTGGANAMLVQNTNWTPLEGDEVERQFAKPYFGDDGSTMVTQYVKLAFEVELAGVAAAGDVPGYDPLLRACAVDVTATEDVSVVYTPKSPPNLQSVTIYINVGTNLQKVTSGMANCKLTLNAKGIPVYAFEFWGTYQAVTNAALPAVDYTDFQPPLGVNATNTTLALFGEAVACSAFTLDFGNVVIKRDLVNLDTVEITNRRSTGSITFDNTLASTKNWTELARTSTKGVLALQHGQGATNVVEVDAPAVQIGKPSYGEDNGIQQITLPLRYTAVSGNDEWAITVR